MSNLLPLLIAALLFPGGLFALAFGLALKGADRRVAARLQGRVGPPLAQPGGLHDCGCRHSVPRKIRDD